MLLASVRGAAQFSFSLNVGTVMANEGDDPYSLKNTWQPVGNSGSESLVFYEGGLGTSIKLAGMWEVSEIFSVGLVYRIIGWNLEHSHRSSDMNSLGGQFRVNFGSNTNKVVPFFQGAYYFSNNNTLSQNQATEGAQTQPAFTITQKTSVGFDADLGVEFKLGKSFGIQVTAGYGGTQATDNDLVVSYLNYGAYTPPKHIDGVFNFAFTGGIKYYTGRGAKQRDF